MKRTILSAVRVSLLLLAVGFGLQAAAVKHKVVLVSLEKTEWKLVWLSGQKIDVAAPRQVPYLQLDPDTHHVSGSGGCNRLAGGYELNGNSLKFTQMATTRMACLHGGDTEAKFLDALGQVSSWKIGGGALSLMDANGHVLAKFSAYTPEDAQHPEPANAH